MSELSDVFKNGCLVNLAVSIWGNRKMLSRLVIQARRLNPRFITGIKHPLNPEALEPILDVKNKARNWLYQKTLPFPIRGALFLPRDLVSGIDIKMTDFQTLFYEQVSILTDHYEEYIRESEEEIGEELFNRMDYPLNIRDRFSFEWQFYLIETPGKSSILPPSLYERERAKVVQTITEFKEMTTSILRERFSQMFSHIVGKLSQGKMLRKDDHTIERFQEFLGDFEAMNFQNDEELARLIAHQRKIFKGMRIEDLRVDEIYRERVTERMKEVEEAVEKVIVNRPRRLVTMLEEEVA